MYGQDKNKTWPNKIGKDVQQDMLHPIPTGQDKNMTWHNKIGKDVQQDMLYPIPTDGVDPIVKSLVASKALTHQKMVQTIYIKL